MMNEELKSIAKKTVKIAGATCIAAGAVALMTSATAVKAMIEGGKYLKETVRKIIDEEPKAQEVCAEPVVEEAPAAEE